jgi:cation transport regulator ChaC
MLLYLQWGVAYRLAGTEQQQQQSIAYLEWREKQYDVRRLCHVYSADSPEQPLLQDVLVYIATESPANVNWLGPAPLPAIAQQIATSRCACSLRGVTWNSYISGAWYACYLDEMWVLKG